MKQYGKVIFFDNYNGIIKGIDGIEYILNHNNIDKGRLNKGDNVEFIPEEYTTLEIKKYIARRVKKLTFDKETLSESTEKKPKTRN